MRIAIVGSRGYSKLDEVRQFVREQERTTCIVSGGASGVDAAAVDEARRLGMEYEVHFPDWAVHGRKAGAVRNKRIVDSADEVVAFWDGTSRGTAITMEMARRSGKTLRLFQVGRPMTVTERTP